MTAVPPADPNEPPPPQRGLTREERGRDVSEAQAEAEAETSVPKKLLKWLSPRLVLSQADDYPVVIKQFLQFCLILIYPAWVFGALFMLAVYYLVLLPGYYVLLAVFWVLFWPLRMRQKKKESRRVRGLSEEVLAQIVGLFKRSSGAQVSVTPAVVSPRQTVQATVTTDKPVDKVSSATLEWGYTNFYRYRWAGRADAAATAANDSWLMMGEVGSDAGSEKDTEDWVGVTKVELPVAGGEFSGGSSSFTVPSWAPGSSEVLARWSARVTIGCGGRDVDTRGDFTVVIGRDDLQVTDAPQARTGGDGETATEIVLPSLAFRAGETINGSITLTPSADMSDGELKIYWGHRRISHPLERTPVIAGGTKSGPTIKLGKGIALRHNTPVTVPFAVPLPEDAPTGEAVHSSLVWFLEATLSYAKWTQGIEQVRRQIVVVNAP